jgi:hypothetical protein
MVLPFLALGAYLTILDFRIVFFFLLAAIPLSTELMLPGGFGLDFPDEPLMLLLTEYSYYMLPVMLIGCPGPSFGIPLPSCWGSIFMVNGDGDHVQ